MIKANITEEEFNVLWDWLIEHREAYVFKSSLAAFDARSLKIGDRFVLTSAGFPPEPCEYKCENDLLYDFSMKESEI